MQHQSHSTVHQADPKSPLLSATSATNGLRTGWRRHQNRRAVHHHQPKVWIQSMLLMKTIHLKGFFYSSFPPFALLVQRSNLSLPQIVVLLCVLGDLFFFFPCHSYPSSASTLTDGGRNTERRWLSLTFSAFSCEGFCVTRSLIIPGPRYHSLD